ncbi:MAG: hypothetical protein ACLUOI_34240 [Eisenbergiella sp.]
MDITCFVSAYMDTFNSVGQLANLTSFPVNMVPLTITGMDSPKHCLKEPVILTEFLLFPTRFVK